MREPICVAVEMTLKVKIIPVHEEPVRPSSCDRFSLSLSLSPRPIAVRSLLARETTLLWSARPVAMAVVVAAATVKCNIIDVRSSKREISPTRGSSV